MNNAELFTVKEVADILGCSVQAVYNRLEKDFKPYLKIENGKKHIDRAVLQLIQPQEDSSEFKTNFKEVLKLLEKQNEQLSNELSIKNKQIEELQKQNAELTSAIKTQAESINADRHTDLAEAIIEGNQKLITDGSEKVSRFQRLKQFIKGT